MKRATALFLLLFFAFTACQNKQPLYISGRTMGTSYHITIADGESGNIASTELQSKIDSLLKEVNFQMSTYVEESEISRFNRRYSREPFVVSEEFVTVLRLALNIYRESAGAFDVTVAPLVDLWGFGTAGTRKVAPSPEQISRVGVHIGSDKLLVLNDTTIAKKDPLLKLDLSAIAKGYGVDAVAEVLTAYGYRNYLVEIGGEVVAKGVKYGKKWRIGIDHPDFNAIPGQNLEAVLLLSEAAVATSGDYRNYFMVGDTVYTHAIDPATGRPIHNGVASVTVIAPNCTLADAMATAIMVMGAQEGLRWAEKKEDVECFIIIREQKGYRILKSSGFDGFILK